MEKISETMTPSLLSDSATGDRKAPTTHTPGPWSVPHFAEPDVNCRCEYVLCDHLMGAIAAVHCSGEGDDWQKHGDSPKFAEAVANARLIAAAPEMLEALVAIRNDVGVFRHAGTAPLKLVRAAIAKATGAA